MAREKFQLGFTILEVMLVLAITGSLVVGLMAGIQANITNQRYNDSINSFRDFLQDQYNRVNSMEIQDRVGPNKDNACETGVDVGRTNCFVVGRLLVTNYKWDKDSSEIAPIGVVGWDVIATGVNRNVISNSSSLTSLFKDSTVKTTIEPLTREEYQLAWDAKLGKASKFSDLEQKAVLILRSPIDGSVVTYIGSYDGSAIKGDHAEARTTLPYVLIEEANLLNQASFCVVPEGINFLTKQAVAIRANGANASAVEVAPRDEEINGFKPVKCNK